MLYYGCYTGIVIVIVYAFRVPSRLGSQRTPNASQKPGSRLFSRSVEPNPASSFLRTLRRAGQRLKESMMTPWLISAKLWKVQARNIIKTIIKHQTIINHQISEIPAEVFIEVTLRLADQLGLRAEAATFNQWKFNALFEGFCVSVSLCPPRLFFFNKYVRQVEKLLGNEVSPPGTWGKGPRRLPRCFRGPTPQGPRHDWSERLRTKCRSRRHREAQLRFRRLSRKSGWKNGDDDMRYFLGTNPYPTGIMFLTQKCRLGGFFS